MDYQNLINILVQSQLMGVVVGALCHYFLTEWKERCYAEKNTQKFLKTLYTLMFRINEDAQNFLRQIKNDFENKISYGELSYRTISDYNITEIAYQLMKLNYKNSDYSYTKCVDIHSLCIATKDLFESGVNSCNKLKKIENNIQRIASDTMNVASVIQEDIYFKKPDYETQ